MTRLLLKNSVMMKVLLTAFVYTSIWVAGLDLRVYSSPKNGMLPRIWLSEIQSPKIQVWLSKYTDYLSNRIELCQIREEREF